MFITPRIFGNRYVLGQQKTQTPAPTVSNTKPKLYSSIYDQPNAPKTVPANAIGQRSDGSYITPTQPKVETQVDQQVQPSATDKYIQNIQARGQSRIDEQQKTLGDYLKAIQEQNLLRKQEAEAQKADEEAKYGKFVERTKAGAQEVATASQGLKDVTRENYGQALKQGAQAGREQEALLTNRFANANTIDSSAFQNAMINSKAGLVGGQQSILNEQARKLNEIESSVVKAQKDAQDLIDSEGVKLQTALRQINNTYAQGSIEYRQAVAEAYQLANENINSIKDNLDQLSYNAEQEKLKLGNADNLSESFLKTGVPQTMNDLIFRQKNPDKAKSIYEQAQLQGQNANPAKQELLDVVENIRKGDIGGMTGGFQTAWIPGSKSAMTLNYYNQLKGLLSLEGRAKLKGSGPISDFESKTLDRAASALGRNLSEDQFRQILDDLYTAFGGSNEQTSNNTNLGQFEQ